MALHEPTMLTNLPAKSFIFGAPGAGKTTFSWHLKHRLKSPVVEADKLRVGIAQLDKTAQEDPLLYVGVRDAYQHFGDLTFANVVKGLQALRQSMAPYVLNEVQLYPDKLILEGSFLAPEQLQPFGIVVLVATELEAQHERQFFTSRARNAVSMDWFRSSRLAQTYMLHEAHDQGIAVLNNTGDMPALVDRFLRRAAIEQE